MINFPVGDGLIVNEGGNLGRPTKVNKAKVTTSKIGIFIHLEQINKRSLRYTDHRMKQGNICIKT